MRCPSCGKNLPDGTAFCTACGAKLGSTLKGTAVQPHFEESRADRAVKTAERKKGPPKKKFLGAAIGVLAVLIVAGAAAFLLMNRDLRQFESAVKRQELSSAVQAYSQLDMEDRLKANSWLQEYLQTLEADYYKGKYEYTDAKARMDDLCQFDSVRTEAERALERIEIDNTAVIAHKKAQQYAEEEKWEQAYEALAGLNTTYRNYDEAAALRSECAKKYKEVVLAQCETLASGGEYQKLISSLLTALKIMPNDTDLSLKLQSYTDQFEEATLAEAERLAQGGDYAGAKDLLTTALGIRELDSFYMAMDRYQEAINEQEYQQLVADCEQRCQTSGTEAVIQYLYELMDQESFDMKRRELLDQYQQKYVAEILERASVKAGERDFEGAIQLLQNARNVYDCAEFQNAISNYEGYLPIDLMDCHRIDETDDFNDCLKENVEDQFGNQYDRAICWIKYGNYQSEYSDYAVFFPDKKYISLRGTLAPRKCDSRTKGYISIYLDGELAYQSPTINCTTEPLEFNVDVSGCSQMRLELHYIPEGVGYWDTFGVLISAKLS